MNFSVFSRYYFLASNGQVPDIPCGENSEHLGLFPKLDDEDNIVLLCVECSYKKKPGINLYNQLKKEIIRLGQDSDRTSE